MKLLSVITPTFEPVEEYFLAAYKSILSQEMPDGWEWEWVIQEDGKTGGPREMLPDDDRISFGMNRKAGVAGTRNLALARTRGRLVKNLDSDDLLTDGVLARDIAAMEADPEIGWATSRVLDLLPDGSTVGFDGDPEHGRLEKGVVREMWRTHNYRAPVHPTTICIRRDLAVRLGGWLGVPGSDDTGLLIAASVVSAGYFNSTVGLLYRKWPGQVTASPDHTGVADEWTVRMGFIDARAELLATSPVGP